MSGTRLALELGVPSGRISDIPNHKRGISADTALRALLRQRARFWAEPQLLHDLEVAERGHGIEIAAPVRFGRRC